LQAKLGLAGNQVSAQTSTTDTANQAIVAAGAQAAPAAAKLKPLPGRGCVTARSAKRFSARTALAAARGELARTHAQGPTDAVAPAFSTGRLTSAAALP
jgi:hypothetical protein